MIADNSHTNAEQTVKNFLSNYGLTSTKFSKEELRNGSTTPDYRVYKNDKLFGYCEVKNTQKDTWLNNQFEKDNPYMITGGSRNDPVFNRISTHIHKAGKQFDAVNRDQKSPNILSIYNEDEQSGFLDLLAVTTGNFFAENGTVSPIYKHISEGRIKQDIEKIHLFIWIDAHMPNRFLFNTINTKFLSKLCSEFHFDPEKLELTRQ